MTPMCGLCGHFHKRSFCEECKEDCTVCWNKIFLSIVERDKALRELHGKTL
jgi:hypothetical protein